MEVPVSASTIIIKFLSVQAFLFMHLKYNQLLLVVHIMLSNLLFTIMIEKLSKGMSNNIKQQQTGQINV